MSLIIFILKISQNEKRGNKMNEVNFQTKTIKGKKIRTDNQHVEEIVSLWMEVPQMNLIGELYAVYYNYESDHRGKYDLLIGSETNQLKESVDLLKGNYLVINVDKGTPELIGKTWQTIWSDQDIYQKRAFTTDFECYLADGSAKIYLAIR